MKQRITPEQLNELTEEQIDRLREWWNPWAGDIVLDKSKTDEDLIIFTQGSRCYLYNVDWLVEKQHLNPLLSIGQMIEYLLATGVYTHDMYIQVSKNYKSNVHNGWRNAEDGISDGAGTSLCDALWEAVKHSLGEVKE